MIVQSEDEEAIQHSDNEDGVENDKVMGNAEN